MWFLGQCEHALYWPMVCMEVPANLWLTQDKALRFPCNTILKTISSRFQKAATARNPPLQMALMLLEKPSLSIPQGESQRPLTHILPPIPLKLKCFLKLIYNNHPHLTQRAQIWWLVQITTADKASAESTWLQKKVLTLAGLGSCC